MASFIQCSYLTKIQKNDLNISSGKKLVMETEERVSVLNAAW